MRVLGIDCGTELTGYGVIDSDGRAHRIVAAGTIRTSPKATLGDRLNMVFKGTAVAQGIATHAPETGAVEEVFHSVNTKSALKLAHVRGVALLVLAEAGILYGEYSPLTIKKSVVGHGRAEKEQVQFMMRAILGATAPVEQPDACDALAVAICHVTHIGRAAA
jgi:crossover junction endodeoxyribonuclease RuvC